MWALEKKISLYVFPSCKYVYCMHVCSLYVLPSCKYVYLYACLLPTKPRRGHWIPECEVNVGYGPPCRCWKRNLGPLQEWEVLLMAGPFL